MNRNIFQNKNRNSFTLIELLVVLALVAILSVVVVMTLNPAELIKQARDSNRLSDLATINTSLNLFASDVTNGFMGTSTVIYVSIPDTSPTCANLGLPLLPTSTYTYNCVTQANLRNTDGTGWIPVNLQHISSNSPISQLPIDPINTTTSLNYYTYMSGGSWKLSAISLESQKYLAEGNKDGGTAPSSYEIGNDLTLGQTIFPNGWIKVPGSSTFGTSDFYVMKYEAKCADTSGNLLTSPTEASYQIYHAGTTPCTSANSRYVASAPHGYPIGRIYQSYTGADNDTVEYCQSIGAHLITNNEWQTIAWNIQNNAQNWSNGVVGSGYLGRGNCSAPSAQVASVNDTDSTYLTGYTDFIYRRTQVLSNGQIIWDFAGNLWDLTSETMIASDQPHSAATNWGWKEYANITSWGAMTQSTAGPANTAWLSTNGIGRMYSWDGSVNETVYALARGGAYNTATAYAGVEAGFLGYTPTNANYILGFRCAK